ncbi:MAG: WD40 repeat domain-containing protein [Oculatellaceae cyanobacterium Prado106]|jgi:WD40 repeat protein|nr:WD40 repeat domain-containing protein [Oculatellaceae cyanobacterium Prado106]
MNFPGFSTIAIATLTFTLIQSALAVIPNFGALRSSQGLNPSIINAASLTALPLSQAQPQRSDPTWQPGTVSLLTIGAQQQGHSSPVRSVVFSPDGQFLASGSVDKTVKIWNLQKRSLERTLSPQVDQVDAIAFSPDGQYLASGCLNGAVMLWDWQSGKLLSLLTEQPGNHTELVTSVAFSPDSQILASGSGDKTIRLWDVNAKTLRQTIATSQFIETLAFAPTGTLLASAGLERTVDLWNWTSGERVRSLGPYGRAIYAIAFSPDGQTLAFSPNSVCLTPRCLEQRPTGTPPSSSTQRPPEGNHIRLWSLQGQPSPQTMRGHLDWINSIAFSPSGQTLISGSMDRTIRLWNTETGELIREFQENDRRILSVAFRPDGRAFALGSADGTIKLFISQE